MQSYNFFFKYQNSHRKKIVRCLSCVACVRLFVCFLPRCSTVPKSGATTGADGRHCGVNTC